MPDLGDGCDFELTPEGEACGKAGWLSGGCEEHLICCVNKGTEGYGPACTAEADDCARDLTEGHYCDSSSYNFCAEGLVCDTSGYYTPGPGTCQSCDDVCSSGAGCAGSNDTCICCDAGEAAHTDNWSNCWCTKRLDTGVPDLAIDLAAPDSTPDKAVDLGATDKGAPDSKPPDVTPDKGADE